MSMLSTENLGLSFGAFDLFRGINLTIANDSKIGLIGSNGVGKTSLLLILAGINQPTTGKVHIAKGKRIGYLRQEAVDAFADRDHTVYTEMLTVFTDLIDQQNRLHEMEAQMAQGDTSEALLARYGQLQEAFERAGGYEFDLRIQQTLAGLGLGKNDWDTPLKHLSGGQKTRALLARLLLEKPDLLMLDEPTNHLDIEAVEWLERILREWEGAVLIVSHDRYFLDNTVNLIWEMSRAGIENYPGNYSSYLVERQNRWEYYARVFEEEKTRLTKEMDFVQRNWVRATTHARALGVLRRVGRDLAIVENYGVMALRSGRKWSEYDADTIRGTERPLDVIDAIRRVNAISMPSARPPVIRPRLGSDHVSGTLVLRAHNVDIGYPASLRGYPANLRGSPNNLLFTIRNLELRRGACAALIGPNGAGKTSLIRTLLGQIPTLRGELQLGASLKIGYFAQAHDGLDPRLTVLDQLLAHKEMDAEKARGHLAQYLFRGEDVFNQVGQLSGGERARLALAILALEGSNLLLLDEPTNHLDIPAREALQEVLDQYSGTIVLVSHDRYLIDRLATQIWEIKGNQLDIFAGTYREYVLRRAGAGSQANGRGRQMILPPKPLVRDNSRETKQRMLELARVEERIHQQEGAIKRLSAELQKAGAGGNHEKAHKLGWQVAQAQAALEQLMGEWERLAEP